MTERKWTPGPWVVSGGNGRILSHWEGIGYWEIANAAETSFKGDSGDEYFTDGDIEANAHLISAAPDLYDSNEWLLKTLLDVLVGKTVRDADEAISFAYTAQSKARGEKQ